MMSMRTAHKKITQKGNRAFPRPIDSILKWPLALVLTFRRTCLIFNASTLRWRDFHVIDKLFLFCENFTFSHGERTVRNVVVSNYSQT